MKISRLLEAGAAIAAAATLASPVKAQQPALDLSQGVLTFNGPITPAVLAVFERVPWSKVRLVKVQSEGGDIRSSIGIGRLISAHGAAVEVHDDCESACFNILISGRPTTIDVGTIVLLHQSISGQFALAHLHYPNLIEPQRAAAAAERDWLSENGVDPDLLVFAEWMRSPQCISAPSDTPSAAPLLRESHRYAMWAPRDETLRRAGVKLGSWKQNPSLVVVEMAQTHPFAKIQDMRNGSEPQWTSAAVSAAKVELSRVPRCR